MTGLAHVPRVSHRQTLRSWGVYSPAAWTTQYTSRIKMPDDFLMVLQLAGLGILYKTNTSPRRSQPLETSDSPRTEPETELDVRELLSHRPHCLPHRPAPSRAPPWCWPAPSSAAIPIEAVRGHTLRVPRIGRVARASSANKRGPRGIGRVAVVLFSK